MAIRKLCKSLALGLALLMPFSACAPEEPGALGIKMRFANMEQAEMAGSGLPSDIVGLKVDVYQMGLDQPPVATSGCIDLNSDQDSRQSVSFDLSPSDNLAVMVAGFDDSTCSDLPSWKGVAFGVELSNKEETTVSIYVTRTGFRLNNIRDELPRGRAFASATSLSDGRVLIAGGFDRLQSSSTPVVLEAACDALLYNPGTAMIEKVVPLANGCRALHQAVQLSDGRVVLVGGTSQAIFDPTGITRPMVRPDVNSLLSSVEVFDPENDVFLSGLTPDSLLRRAQAAAVVLEDDTVLALGGRSAQIRSSDLVSGVPGSWTWTKSASGLLQGRSGAQALFLSDGVLVAGGNLPGGPALELIDPDDLSSQALTPDGLDLDLLALSGHSLVKMGMGMGGSSFVLAGGVSNAPGGLASDRAFSGIMNQGELTITEYTLARKRAYHQSIMLTGLGVGGLIQTVHVGGLDAQGTPNMDLEKTALGGDGQLLEDQLETGSIGLALAKLPDGSALIVGGLGPDPANSSQLKLYKVVQILSP